MESGGFRLPTDPLLPDDMRLTIQAIGPAAQVTVWNHLEC